MDKTQLQDELKAKKQEAYEMAEKIIFLEYKGHSLEDPLSKLANLQDLYDKLVDQNVRRVGDMTKLRESLNRLKSDLGVFQLSR